MAKPAFDTKAKLIEALQLAMQVEHFTVAPYLCAQYSIKEGTNADARRVIQSVVMEEMLHMVLVANLLRALGAHSQVNDPARVPTYPNSLPGLTTDYVVNLLPFSKPALDTFIAIEKPQERSPLTKDGQFHTIGAFYEAIKESLKWLCKTEGESNILSNTGDEQVGRGHYYGGAGTLIEVKTLKDALAVLEEIIVQGEGTSESEALTQLIKALNARENGADSSLHMGFGGYQEPPHYYRFKEIRYGRYYELTPNMSVADSFKPTGTAFLVQWHDTWNMQRNPKMGMYPDGSPIRRAMVACNASYSRLLDFLHIAFNGYPAYLTKAVGAMYEMKYRAIELMRTPNPDREGTTVGPSFEYLTCEQRQQLGEATMSEDEFDKLKHVNDKIKA